MRCEAVKDLLEAYVEGELDGSELRSVESHISGCELCKKELALTRSMPRLVKSLSTPPVPEDIILNTLERLNETSAARQQWLREFMAFLSGKWKFAAVASLLLSAVLLGIGYQWIGRGPRISEKEVASAMEELELALGIVSVATRGTQFSLLSEGAQILDATKTGPSNAIQSISHIQIEISEELWSNLADLAQLNL